MREGFSGSLGLGNQHVVQAPFLRSVAFEAHRAIASRGGQLAVLMEGWGKPQGRSNYQSTLVQRAAPPLAVRKGFAFPGDSGPFILFGAGWKAEPSSLRGGGRKA